ncbi:MAG: glycosyltransferase [Calditrichaeota bacterium]|nr:MAG: glycosyltransferase [Calditrichota bacterium]MBL1204596.1 glycosyltransferase [Calditrichota bacterium]NOG44425.1 glycosyltransferase family 4 protein [Calditrichota bacterium]
MKILLVHNRYKLAGGEDTVFKNELELLESKGNQVRQFIKDNKEIDNYSISEKVSLIGKTTYSRNSYLEIAKIFKDYKPDVCHIHNFFPLISPSIFSACQDNKIPVIQTLHNYRLICPGAYLYRDGHICEECSENGIYKSVKYGCYRESKLQTYTVARMIQKNSEYSTWNTKIDGYITLTNFAKQKFIQNNFPKNKIYKKSNFLFEDPGVSKRNVSGFIFVGRLDETKGLDVLIQASRINNNFKINIAGDGPLKPKFPKDINYLGLLNKEGVHENIKTSLALIFPSVWYEGMPMTIIEAFACGRPVIASNLGAMAEMIEDGKTGLLFEPGNAKDLANKMQWAMDNKDKMAEMGKNARKEFEEKYTAEKNYERLMEIYRAAIDNARKKYALKENEF